MPRGLYLLWFALACAAAPAATPVLSREQAAAIRSAIHELRAGPSGAAADPRIDQNLRQLGQILGRADRARLHAQLSQLESALADLDSTLAMPVRLLVERTRTLSQPTHPGGEF